MQKPDFESIKRFNVLGHEYWSARELMPLLGYGRASWHNFENAIIEAMIAANEAALPMDDHFNAVVERIKAGKGATQARKDYFLSKRVCYLVAQNADPRKPEVGDELFRFYSRSC